MRYKKIPFHKPNDTDGRKKFNWDNSYELVGETIIPIGGIQYLGLGNSPTPDKGDSQLSLRRVFCIVEGKVWITQTIQIKRRTE